MAAAAQPDMVLACERLAREILDRLSPYLLQAALKGYELAHSPTVDEVMPRTRQTFLFSQTLQAAILSA
ncbi:hypothetical protein NXC24_PC02033 (plasmid) [Rhizobium sp. NXC24]|nr:hypothetical protein NXC24_PC02033 [Rhizobium sp. NXC24]